VRFVNKTGLLIVDKAALSAERLLSDTSKMMMEVVRKNDWQYGSGTGAEVHYRLLDCTAETEVSIYFPGYKFSKAVGEFDGGSIKINGYKINSFTEMFIAGLLLHEHSHKAGFHHIDPGWWGRKRANYKTENKCKYSVPYFLSENVGRWYES
jgi:hypothetical protein